MSESVCQYCGSTAIRETQREVICDTCSMRVPREGAKPRRRAFGGQKNKKATPPPPTNKATTSDTWRTIQIRDVVTEGDTSEVVQEVQMRIPPSKYVPELTIDAPKAEFFRWLFKPQVQKDKRYGRDHLKRLGYVRTDEVEDRGRMVTVWEKAE